MRFFKRLFNLEALEGRYGATFMPSIGRSVPLPANWVTVVCQLRTQKAERRLGSALSVVSITICRNPFLLGPVSTASHSGWDGWLVLVKVR